MVSVLGEAMRLDRKELVVMVVVGLMIRECERGGEKEGERERRGEGDKEDKEQK